MTSPIRSAPAYTSYTYKRESVCGLGISVGQIEIYISLVFIRTTMVSVAEEGRIVASEGKTAAFQGKKSPKKVAKKSVQDHPPYAEMIRQALVALKERGGSSRQAILKYLVANFKVGADEHAVNTRLKAALRNGVKSETLKQSKGCGATGSFRLGAASDAKKEKKAAAAPTKKPGAVKKVADKKVVADKKKTVPKKKPAEKSEAAPVDAEKKPASRAEKKPGAGRPKKVDKVVPKKSPAAPKKAKLAAVSPKRKEKVSPAKKPTRMSKRV